MLCALCTNHTGLRMEVKYSSQAYASKFLTWAVLQLFLKRVMLKFHFVEVQKTLEKMLPTEDLMGICNTETHSSEPFFCVFSTLAF